MRKLYKLLSWFWIIKALTKGPWSFIKQRIRAKSIGKFARFMRKIFKP